MICLTGDIHHSKLRTGNQKHCDISEVQVAVNYTKMLQEKNIKVTFFISGKSFADEWTYLKNICDSPLVELGGHNYNCFVPILWHRIWNKLIKSYNGPKWYQRFDAQRTINIIRKKTGKTIQLWRNHMYMHGPYTEKVLSECGIVICSDGVQKNSNGLQLHPDGIYNFPINIMPDHEHLIHAERTPEWIEQWQKRYNWSDDFGPDSYYVDQWSEMVLNNLKKNEEDGIISNMIIHPITLYLCDRFKTLKNILEYIGSRETVHMSELYEAKRKMYI